MSGYTKVFGSLVHSTIWREADHVRIVWITMLVLADRYGEVSASVPGLADASRVTLAQCEEALQRLMSPDPYSRSKESEGRRIREIDGGWVLINHGKYTLQLSAEDRLEKARSRQAAYRSRQKNSESESSVTRDVTLRDSVTRDVTLRDSVTRDVTLRDVTGVTTQSESHSSLISSERERGAGERGRNKIEHGETAPLPRREPLALVGTPDSQATPETQGQANHGAANTIPVSPERARSGNPGACVPCSPQSCTVADVTAALSGSQVPAWAVPDMLQKVHTHFGSDQSDVRTRKAWVKKAATWIVGDWIEGRRPTRPGEPAGTRQVVKVPLKTLDHKRFPGFEGRIR